MAQVHDAYAAANEPPTWVKGHSQYLEPTVFFMFGGGGLGAHGFQQAQTTLRGMTARFRVIGGFDYDRDACNVFRYLTGVEEACVDATTMTPADLRRIAGQEAPDCVVASAPCQGASNLITDEKASTDTYQAMNQLALVGTRLMLEAWPTRPPKFVFYENVPSLVRRAKKVIDAIFAMLKAAGYEIISGIHNARHDSDGPQNRKRWFMVARHVAQVPHFLYRTSKKRGKVCGDVLGPMPMPGDPSGGPMHRISEICALNWWRLWAIPAGQDWRALRKADAGPAKRGGAVALGRAKPGFTSMDHVLSWDDASRTVTGATRPGNGAPSIAAPLPLGMVPQSQNAAGFSGKYAVLPWDGAARTVITADRIGSGAQSVADPRAVDLSTQDSAFHQGSGLGRWGVLTPADVSSTVIANARLNTGPFSYAAPAPQPVDLAPREECNPWCYGVLHPTQAAHVVAATSSVGCGPFSYAGPAPVNLALGCAPHNGAYGVLAATQPAGTVTASANIDNACVALADPRRAQPSHVVLTYEQAKAVADGHVQVPFAIVDPARPGEPLAIVDNWERSPYRWETEVTEKRNARTGKVTQKTTRKKVAVSLVLISADGTWHRPLTTLELAVLQGLPWRHNGAPLDFGVGTTIARQIIGNGIPSGVGKAFGEQVLLALVAAAQGAFYLDSGGAGVWVDPMTERAMRRAGVEVLPPHKAPRFGVTDDGVVVAQAKRPKKARTFLPAARRAPEARQYA